MQLEKMDKNAYFEHWTLESAQFESKAIYERLAKITPTVQVLEIGCGTGLSTQHLAQGRKVLSKIKEFSPRGVVCWFIGSHVDDQLKYTPDTTPIFDKPKKYRENIEDVLLSKNICQETVEWIHLANRGAIVDSERDKAVSATAEDYNQYVFMPCGFEVVSVDIFNWDREGSNFIYVDAKNPALAPGSQTPSVISILAKRKK